ncbi:hypothetical protein Ddye_029594 [Dipteronia dyeriana]|uniref:Uncharacterized protein n=1 Tax=Dipteronia dyeriana TaxID=168575 RepID=A0AAD9WLN6_9ROSI|nr:hypothetical protein Ddye_029594 [Dipteronia dyeriana]
MQHLILPRQVAFFCCLRHYHTMLAATVTFLIYQQLVKEGGRSEIRFNSREGLCNVVFDMASVANVHLQKARTVLNEARPVLLQAVPAQVLLDSLSRVHFDVFDPSLAQGVLGVPPLWYRLKLKWYSRRKKY